MMRGTHVLVGYDATEDSERALLWAVGAHGVAPMVQTRKHLLEGTTEPRFGRVVVGVDGSAGGEAALAMAWASPPAPPDASGPDPSDPDASGRGRRRRGLLPP